MFRQPSQPLQGDSIPFARVMADRLIVAILPAVTIVRMVAVLATFGPIAECFRNDFRLHWTFGLA